MNLKIIRIKEMQLKIKFLDVSLNSDWKGGGGGLVAESAAQTLDLNMFFQNF